MSRWINLIFCYKVIVYPSMDQMLLMQYIDEYSATRARLDIRCVKIYGGYECDLCNHLDIINACYPVYLCLRHLNEVKMLLADYVPKLTWNGYFLDRLEKYKILKQVCGRDVASVIIKIITSVYKPKMILVYG